MKLPKLTLKRILIPIIALILAGVLLASLFWFGVLKFNYPSTKAYPVRGVDVSVYQGDVDWQVLAAQNVDFAFIKATEGSSFVDPNFETNYENAIKTDLRVGAYHFFSFDSGGDTQAQNFIDAVYPYDNMLPPVIDVEYYGDYLKAPPADQEAVRRELFVMLDALEAHYGIKPIIYATVESYQYLLSGYFDEYDLWIRSVYSKPPKEFEDKWTFWQYTNRQRLDGYDGKEKYIDMNVFFGTREEFEKYGKKTHN